MDIARSTPQGIHNLCTLSDVCVGGLGVCSVSVECLDGLYLLALLLAFTRGGLSRHHQLSCPRHLSHLLALQLKLNVSGLRAPGRPHFTHPPLLALIQVTQ